VNPHRSIFRSLAVVTLAAALLPAAADQNFTNSSSGEVLVTGSLGRLVSNLSRLASFSVAIGCQT
jgi:hypothetical protein